MTGPADVPALAGVHHLKLPVSDLARSLEWYRSRLGYRLQVEFTEDGIRKGVGLRHPPGAVRTSACGSTRSAPPPRPVSTTSRSACRTGPPSRRWPRG
ncbi:glyoxalase/bleomycin resistance protein/dioxygenase superfamily protein [Prauserella shujinwangii]|uniref:Glyoxalase/bleomycin resistance protein/dioxygenase superfamily protein n=1 Tax=Prauserella shujinwangii TaxID=1453103 RepID=A0A2T0LW62_9PSEU|nr:glyoxalase/bleomycin resistance protein/dioxygenase superfamily protein [Prauserella shujinwangii]